MFSALRVPLTKSLWRKFSLASTLTNERIDKWMYQAISTGAGIGGIVGGISIYHYNREEEKKQSGLYYSAHSGIPKKYHAMCCVLDTTLGVVIGASLGYAVTALIPIIVPIGTIVIVARYLDPPPLHPTHHTPSRIGLKANARGNESAKV